jgi:cystathionine gamma-synthase
MSGIRAATRATRAGIDSDSQHGAVVPPIHLSSTFSFTGLGGKRQYDYTRSGNPTRAHLAGAIADLEGGAGAVITSTGMSAVALVLQLVKPGELVLAAHDCYGGTQRLLRALASRGLIEVVFADLTCVTGDAAGEIARRTPRLVWVETPSNPLLRITDIRAVAGAARAAGSLLVVDNTFLSPALQRPFELGADIVVHSTTKYLNGHSDVVGGAVVARESGLADDLAWWANCTGVTGAPFDSWLTLRGLRTLHPRLVQHQANAEAVVAALCAHDAVSATYYPGLATHGGHEVACAQQHGFGAMASFELRGGLPAVERFARTIRFFTLAESLGGVESLVAHPASMTHASMDPASQRTAGISESLLRLSVGIEDTADLVEDLTAALDAAAASDAPRVAVSARVAKESGIAVRDRSTDVVLVGAGSVGRALLGQIDAHLSERREDSPFRIVGVADSTAVVTGAVGLNGDDLRALASHKAAGFSLASASTASTITPSNDADVNEAFKQIFGARERRGVVVDVTAAETSPLLEHAMDDGWNVVLANKRPIAGAQASVDRLHELGRRNGTQLLYEATVGAGLPVLDTLRKLKQAGDRILSVEGCPSGTLGFLFAQLAQGRTVSQALREAIAAGYTEPDPRDDLSGTDVARKAIILARGIGWRGDPSVVSAESLVPIGLRCVSREEFLARIGELDAADSSLVERARMARFAGQTLRYRVRVSSEDISVGVVAVSSGEPLGNLEGTDNQFAFRTTHYNDRPLVITGPGAGAQVTASAVLSDLLAIAS